MTTTPATTSPAASTVGGVLFARYAYPPNEHAYCGPADAEEVFADATGQQDARGLRSRAEQFAGAWPYLQLIAGANDLDDPLDPRVVRGYWLGERAAGAVGLTALAAHVDERFRHRSGRGWRHLGAALRPGAVPDHAFHVLAVYPWVGLLREGVTEPARTILESCVVRPGLVHDVTGDLATVSVPTLGWTGARLVLVGRERRELRWKRDGLALTPQLLPGDHVAVHWDWICERLQADDADALTRRLRTRLASVRC